MNFIQSQQEEAREKHPLDSFYGCAMVWHTDLDSLISQVVQNTVEEIERRVNAISDGQEHETNEQYLAFEDAIDKVQSILKDITTES